MTRNLRASDLVAEKVKQLRRRRAMTAEQLAARCADLGAPQLSPAVLANVETGRRDKATGRRRRDLSIDEVLVLAAALDVPPVELLRPEGADRLAVTATLVIDPMRVVTWCSGLTPPHGPSPFAAFATVGFESAPIRMLRAFWESVRAALDAENAAERARRADDEPARKQQLEARDTALEDLARVVTAALDAGMTLPRVVPRHLVDLMAGRGLLAVSRERLVAGEEQSPHHYMGSHTRD